MSKLTNSSEILFRQIHPDFLDAGEPGSSSFMPGSGDDGLMSVDRSTLTSAAAAHALYTRGGLRSDAVFGLTVGEFAAQEVPTVADPIEASAGMPDNPAHALADFTAHGTSARRRIAKALKRLAIARGRLHP